MMNLSAKSFAKINLFLYILGERADGYHNIYTLFLPISLHDTITLELSDKTELITNSEALKKCNDNIILKTDKILRENYNLKDNFKISLDKLIPIGAGLGGGSSNAATYMNMVNSCSTLNLTEDDKFNIMKSVGSDTVFFINSKTSIGSGRGEILQPFHIPFTIYILLINPKISISTREAFTDENLRLTDSETVFTINNINSFDKLKSIMKNDFEYSVFMKHRLIKDIIGELNNFDNSSKAMMTGTGSTIFAVYKDRLKRDIAFNHFKNRYEDFIIVATESIE